VGKRFGRRVALEQVDLRLDPHDFVLLTGPNGSGKTTLLRLLAGVARPSTGRVALGDGNDAEGARRTTGYAGHQPLLYDELTALENVVFVLRMHGVGDPEARASAWIARFGLRDREHERVVGFSRGMRQRLALARVFALAPRLMLLDEPGTALDADGMRTLVEALAEQVGKGAVVLATHDPVPFRSLARRNLTLQAGRLAPEVVS